MNVVGVFNNRSMEAMAGYEINVGFELLPGFLNGQNGLSRLVAQGYLLIKGGADETGKK